MTEIVKRLRLGAVIATDQLVSGLHRDAADEIERLRLLLIGSTRRIPHVLGQIDREFGGWPVFTATGVQVLASLTQAGVGLMHPTGAGGQIFVSLTQAGVESDSEDERTL